MFRRFSHGQREHLKMDVAWPFPNSLRMLSCRNLNPSPKEVLVVIQKSDHLPWGGGVYSQQAIFKNLSLQILRSHSSQIIDFCWVSSLQRTSSLISCQLSWDDGKIFYLSSFFNLIFLKGKRTALLFCRTTYSLIYNAGQQGLVSVYSGSSEDTRLFILKLDS